MKRFFLIVAFALLAPLSAMAQTTHGASIASTSSPGNNILKILNLGPGQLMIGQGFLTDPIAAYPSGDLTMNGAGAFSVTKSGGVPFATGAFVATGTSGTTLPVLDANNIFSGLDTFTGHVAVGAVPPVLTSCGGGSPAILGDDKAGLVTMGTSATGCVITFASAYTSTPFCVVTWQATPLASQSYAISTTAITLTQTSTSSNKANYICLAQNGG